MMMRMIIMMLMITMMLMMRMMLVITMMLITTPQRPLLRSSNCVGVCAPTPPAATQSQPKLLTRPGRRDTCPRPPTTPQQPPHNLLRQFSNWPTTLGETSSLPNPTLPHPGRRQALRPDIGSGVQRAGRLQASRRLSSPTLLLRLSSCVSPPASLLLLRSSFSPLSAPSYCCPALMKTPTKKNRVTAFG